MRLRWTELHGCCVATSQCSFYHQAIARTHACTMLQEKVNCGRVPSLSCPEESVIVPSVHIGVCIEQG